ncbi:glycosyltransferase family 4 protein [Klebsiella quasipneumoniae]|uniref:Glycosyl transferase n=1 Tax=Klebsiella sp. 708 TaxID=97470 RepID=A0A0P0YSS8_9ENTR|nr:glycosyltransferase family 1 protein [Klebsiella quasipneumoniae]MCJ8555651.1 glycosyltransferase family 4 protein [Klebsiella quasipneumoniae]BAT24406.1 glycosyl transferase [Klebsiella sp. 708]
MREIIIDMRWEGSGGIGTFAKEVNRINEYKESGFKGKPYSPLDSFKISFELFKRKSKYRNKIIFFPGYIPPVFSLAPYVFTIHDLNHLDRPENSSFMKRLFYNYVIKRGCKKAELIFTVSEFSKKRIVEWSGVSPSKIINVGNGVSSLFAPEGDKKEFGFNYILCVSNRKKHKNEFETLRAYKQSGLHSKIKLVFTGNPDKDILAHIKTNNLTEHVHFTGYLPDSELPELYRGASAVVFISLYEGFGLPVIEAMASGVPVVTSNTTSLCEVAGDSALLVDPTDTDEIALALIKIINDDEVRNERIKLGLEQVKKYSWVNVAKKVDENIKKCL